MTKRSDSIGENPRVEILRFEPGGILRSGKSQRWEFSECKFHHTTLFRSAFCTLRTTWQMLLNQRCWRESVAIHPSIGSIHKAITVLARKKVEHLGNPLVPLGKMQHFANQDASRLCCNIQCYLAACLQGLTKCKNFTTLWAILQSKVSIVTRPTATYLQKTA